MFSPKSTQLTLNKDDLNKQHEGSEIDPTTEKTHMFYVFLFTPMETRDSILLRIHRLTNDVYFVGTNYNDISVPVKGNLRFELPKSRPSTNRLHTTHPK